MQAMNEQINVEYTNSLVYHAAHAYFARDNIGLPGFAAYFLKESVEERSHAQLLMDYQNQRGGRVKLQARAAAVLRRLLSCSPCLGVPGAECCRGEAALPCPSSW